MSDQDTDKTNKEAIPHMAPWQYLLSGATALGAGAGGMYRKVEQELYDLIEDSDDFRPIVKDTHAARAWVHDRQGNPIFAVPLNKETQDTRVLVQRSADKKYLLRHGADPIHYTPADIIIDPHTGIAAVPENWQVSNRIWLHKDGKIVHPDGETVVHVNEYGLMIPASEMNADGQRMTAEGESAISKSKPRALFVAEGAATETRAEYAKRFIKQRRIKNLKMAEFAQEHFKIDMANGFNKFFHGMGVLSPYSKVESILSATVAAVVAGGGVLMFFNSQNQSKHIHAMNRKIDHLLDERKNPDSQERG